MFVENGLTEFVAVDYKKTKDIKTTCTILNSDTFSNLSIDEVLVVHMFDKDNKFFTYEILKFKTDIMKHFMLTFFKTFPCIVYQSSKYVDVDVVTLRHQVKEKLKIKLFNDYFSIDPKSLIELVFDTELNEQTDSLYVWIFNTIFIFSLLYFLMIVFWTIPTKIFIFIIDCIKSLVYQILKPTNQSQQQQTLPEKEKEKEIIIK